MAEGKAQDFETRHFSRLGSQNPTKTGVREHVKAEFEGACGRGGCHPESRFQPCQANDLVLGTKS